MKLTASPFVMILLSLSLAVHAEDFDWSWEKKAEGGEAEPAPAAETAEAQVGQAPAAEAAEAPVGHEPDAPAASEAAAGTEGQAAGTKQAVAGDEFHWTKGTDDEEGVAKETREEQAVPEATGGAVRKPEQRADTDASDALLKENLDLRRKIAEATKADENARRENERLTGQLKDMERKSAQFAALISDLDKQRKASAGDPDQVKDLEARVAAAEKEKAKSGAELGQLKKAMEEQKKAADAAVRRAAESVKAPPSSGTEGVKPGSDLYKEKEKENGLLKEKLLDIETARRKAVKDREDLLKKAERAEEGARLASQKQKELEEKLAAADAVRKESKRTIDKLLEQIPAMEKELSALKSNTTTKDSSLTAKERDLQAMDVELQKREQRIIKAERMTAVLEKARDDVARVSDRERRDMHYNMAAVYSKEGKPRAAEAEYLKALRIDPNDAAVHYNLGILYDDELNEKDKAAMHYKKYLKLNPHGSDVDAVKGWLLKIVMGQ